MHQYNSTCYHTPARQGLVSDRSCSRRNIISKMNQDGNNNNKDNITTPTTMKRNTTYQSLHGCDHTNNGSSMTTTSLYDLFSDLPLPSIKIDQIMAPTVDERNDVRTYSGLEQTLVIHSDNNNRKNVNGVSSTDPCKIRHQIPYFPQLNQDIDTASSSALKRRLTSPSRPILFRKQVSTTVITDEVEEAEYEDMKRQYDLCTWRLYSRIMDYRERHPVQQQQQQQQQSDYYSISTTIQCCCYDQQTLYNSNASLITNLTYPIFINNKTPKQDNVIPEDDDNDDMIFAMDE